MHCAISVFISCHLLAVYSPGIRLSDGIDIVSHGLYPNLYPEGVPDLIH